MHATLKHGNRTDLASFLLKNGCYVPTDYTREVLPFFSGIGNKPMNQSELILGIYNAYLEKGYKETGARFFTGFFALAQANFVQQYRGESTFGKYQRYYKYFVDLIYHLKDDYFASYRPDKNTELVYTLPEDWYKEYYPELSKHTLTLKLLTEL